MSIEKEKNENNLFIHRLISQNGLLCTMIMGNYKL